MSNTTLKQSEIIVNNQKTLDAEVMRLNDARGRYVYEHGSATGFYSIVMAEYRDKINHELYHAIYKSKKDKFVLKVAEALAKASVFAEQLDWAFRAHCERRGLRDFNPIAVSLPVYDPNRPEGRVASIEA